MAQTASNVSAAKPAVGGAIYVAATTAELPTTADGTLGTGFTCLGYISDDGLTNSNAPDTEDIKAWGGDSVLTIYNSKEDTFNFRLIEVLNAETLKVVYGDNNVTGALATGITVRANNKELPSKAYIFDMILRDGALKRIVVPTAQVSDIGEIEYSDSDAIGYDITISAHADASGNTHYEYIKAAAANG